MAQRQFGQFTGLGLKCLTDGGHFCRSAVACRGHTWFCRGFPGCTLFRKAGKRNEPT